jgi:hypothetical protein
MQCHICQCTDSLSHEATFTKISKDEAAQSCSKPTPEKSLQHNKQRLAELWGGKAAPATPNWKSPQVIPA